MRKNKIVSVLLVISMLMAYCPFTYADELNSGDSSPAVESNIAENQNLNDSNEVGLGSNSLSEEKSEKSEEAEGDNDVNSCTNGDTSISSDSDILITSDSVITTNQALDFSLNDNEENKDNSELEIIEDNETENDSLENQIATLELLDDDYAISNLEEDLDSDFGIDSMDEIIDDSFGIDSMDEPVDDVYNVSPDTEILDNDITFDENQDNSGYIVYETPEDAYDGLDMDAPTVLGDTEEPVDATYTMDAKEEAIGYEDVYREPMIFKSYDGLTLYRNHDGSIAASDYVCTNITGADITLIGVEVVPVNGWDMVGRSADFKNMKANTREFRLTVNNQIILDRNGDGYIEMNDPVVYGSGEEVCVPIELEIGPFTETLSEGLFTFVLVFEEIIDYDALIQEAMEEAALKEEAEKQAQLEKEKLEQEKLEQEKLEQEQLEQEQVETESTETESTNETTNSTDENVVDSEEEVEENIPNATEDSNDMTPTEDVIENEPTTEEFVESTEENNVEESVVEEAVETTVEEDDNIEPVVNEPEVLNNEGSDISESSVPEDSEDNEDISDSGDSLNSGENSDSGGGDDSGGVDDSGDTPVSMEL